jgi:hypothetical protein
MYGFSYSLKMLMTEAYVALKHKLVSIALEKTALCTHCREHLRSSIVKAYE